MNRSPIVVDAPLPRHNCSLAGVMQDSMLDGRTIWRMASQNWASKSFELIVAGFALVGLLLAEWMLASAVYGTNYFGVDGKMAQATIIAAVKFSGFLQVTTISPIEGVGSQLLPMNVWANPAYWPFHFLDKTVATDVSGLVALAVFAIACYTMMRCFDVPVTASAIASQLCIVLFAPTVLILALPNVFSLTPGNAVAYAPHLIALGLVARLEPGSWRAVGLTTAVLLGLVLYSLFCDPLWSMVNGFNWATPFAIVIFAPLHMQRVFGRPHIKTVIVRCLSLGVCFIVLLLSGVLEYLYTLSRYTARVQFSAVADRPRMFEFVSTAFYSSSTKYFYLCCALGWLVGLVTLTSRPRVFTLAAIGAFVFYLIFGIAFLLLNIPWTAPIPLYVEQSLLPLYLAAAVAGYWGLGRLVVVRLRIRALVTAQRAFVVLVRLGFTKLALRLALVTKQIGSTRVHVLSQSSVCRSRGQLQMEKLFGRKQLVRMFTAVVVVGIIPAWFVNFAMNGSALYAEQWYEPWPNEPELQRFLSDNTGRAVGEPIRGSVHFWTFSGEVAPTMVSLWANSVHTVDEYSQLVTPQALYTLYALLQNDVTGALNGFVPFPGTSWKLFFKALQLFGVRYYVAEPGGASIAAQVGYRAVTMPRRPLVGAAGLWHIYEFPNPNIGNYSPTEVVTAASALEMASAMRGEDFDFTKQVVLATALSETLVPADDIRLLPIRGGFHLSGHSSGTSIVVLPQQFSNCFRARDERVRLMRADLLMTGVIFSGAIDTDILLDYGIFTPGCRLGDLADIRRLQMKIDSRMPHLSGDRLFPGLTGIVAKLSEAVSGIK